MPARILAFISLMTLAGLVTGQAQNSALGQAQPRPQNWRPALRSTSLKPEDDDTSFTVRASASTAERPAPRSTGELPRTHGQIWREYPIGAYTANVKTTEKPEQAIIDWILRETGTEVWHTEPFSVLNADRETLYVYHTPEMQTIVKDIVDRCVKSEAQRHVFGLRLVTVGSPNWRSKAFPLLNAIDVQTPGLEAWLISKENAILLLSQLRKRSDFVGHNTPNLVIHNAQSQTISRTSPRNFVRAVTLPENAAFGHQLRMGKVDEGYSLQVSPIVSADGRIVDAVMKAQIDQVERFVPVEIDVPSFGGQTQSVEIQVPQMVSWRLHERFRWPSDQVLVLGCGVVATPSPERKNPLGLSNLFDSGPSRADALLFIESKGTAEQNLVDVPFQAQRAIP